ncbi:MAG: Do family serine endopeptidase [Rhizobiales bacterium]|nr:Do family serine endopeptidase [Hyphomicrobiales bacterium]
MNKFSFTHTFWRGLLAVLIALTASGKPSAAEDALPDLGGQESRITPLGTLSHGPRTASELKLSYAPVVRRVAPAVVNVYSRRVVRERASSPFFSDPFFERFFGGRSPFSERERERVRSSLGSGVIISPDGVVITNHHVIKDGTEIKVALADRRELEAEILLKDERTDLAVLRILGDHEPFPSLQFADSDAMEVGDVVLAVGNPFGIGQTVTSGIVSALARTDVGISDFQFFIQTDAAINPGNSGGPLVDSTGAIVGINTAIYSRSGGSHGIGFSIPSNMVRVVAGQALSGSGRVRRPWLGGSLQDVSSDIAESFGLDRPTGAIITEVYPGGPLDLSGIKLGDIITAIDGVVVENGQTLEYRLATSQIGTAARLDIRRESETFTTFIDLIPAPEEPARNQTRITGTTPLAGVHVANLSPALAEERSLSTNARGVIVLKVDPRSPAAQLRLRPDDVIVAIGGREIELVADLEPALEKSGLPLEIVIRRGGRHIRTVIRG